MGGLFFCLSLIDMAAYVYPISGHIYFCKYDMAAYVYLISGHIVLLNIGVAPYNDAI